MRRQFRNGFGLFSLCLLMSCARIDVPPHGAVVGEVRTRPNIILILADDLGWRDLGSYGSSYYETPRLDEFAESGVLFTQAYSAASSCSPTRASILTGQYPARTGLLRASGHVQGELKHEMQFQSRPVLRAAGPSSTNYIADSYYTLGEAMQAEGYSTAFLGKWHLGRAPHIPENNGFDFVVGGRHYAGPPGKDPERAYFSPWRGDTFPKSTRSLNMHIDDYLAQRAAEFIAEHRDTPFFMCFWPYSVHSPFQSKPELIEKWKERADPSNPQHNPVMAAMVEVLDTSVGRVLDAVKENGLDDKTIIIFTSDNGGNMYNQSYETSATNNAPLRSGKGSSYDGGVRVPLIVRWPGVTSAGTVSNVAVTSPDQYPTILEMSGLALRPSDHKDGVSYAPELRGELFERGLIVSETSQPVASTGNLNNASIREDNWKLIRYWYGDDPETHRYELFDIDADIGETNNLASDFPAKTKYLDERLEAFYTDNDIPRPMPNRRYDGRSVGLWASEGEGNAESQNGALVLESSAPGFTATTFFVPKVLRSSLFEFEARAQGLQGFRVDWLTAAPGQKNPIANRGSELAVASQWKRYRVLLDHKRTLRGLRIVPDGSGYMLEIRDARVLSPDGTEMMRYEFN